MYKSDAQLQYVTKQIWNYKSKILTKMMTKLEKIGKDGPGWDKVFGFVGVFWHVWNTRMPAWSEVKFVWIWYEFLLGTERKYQSIIHSFQLLGYFSILSGLLGRITGSFNPDASLPHFQDEAVSGINLPMLGLRIPSLNVGSTPANQA